MAKPRVLVVDDNNLSRQIIERFLAHAGFEVITAPGAEEALGKIRVGLFQPDLIISDVMMPGLDGYEFCRQLRRDPGTMQTPIILLTSRGGVQEKVAGFQAGADDYLVKPVEPAELEARVWGLLARFRALQSVQESPRIQGEVITVFSLRGGAGVSTLAVNISVALAQLWQIKVPVIDLSLAAGHVMMMLDLRGPRGLVELAEDLQAGQIDQQVLDAYLIHHDSGVRALAGPRRPELVDLVPASLVPTILPLLQDQFEYVIIDTGSAFSEHNLEVLDASDVIVLVVNPELASIRACTSALGVFEALGYPDEKICIVLNLIFPRGGVPQKNIEASLRVPITAVIPYEEALFVNAINLGVPPVWRQPTAQASMAIQELAYSLSRPHHTESPPENPSEAWNRVWAYMQRRGRVSRR